MHTLNPNHRLCLCSRSLGKKYGQGLNQRYTGFHNWYQFLIEQARGEAQNINFNDAAKAFVQNTKVSLFRLMLRMFLAVERLTG